MNFNFLFLNYRRNKNLHNKKILHNISNISNDNNMSNNTSANKNKWIVLLTTAIDVNGENEYRKKLYIKQISKWLHYTDYYIYVIESTGVHLNIRHERLKFVSFKLPKLASSSQSESTSILHILNNIKNDPVYIDCTHILKVTGRYFLHNINGVLNNCVPDLDVYIQHRYSIKWQNTEYFGIRKTLLETFLLTVVNEGLMENKFYEFILKNKLKFTRIGPFVNNVARGGDKRIIHPL
jgi:uncharacterized protein (UPF0147 family)